jgi:hypothetical protein
MCFLALDVKKKIRHISREKHATMFLGCCNHSIEFVITKNIL